jgi:hypothetical protein
MRKIRKSFSLPSCPGKNGGAMVIAKRGAQRVHSIVPNQNEWLSVLVAVNAAKQAILAFYIFKG